jgi:FAD/FMN-containing dehydrogenase
VLEFEVVLPTGTIVIANSRSNPDLFWALRGGGGSTFGIVTRVTMKTHPPESLHGVVVSVVPAKSGANADYVRGVAYLLSSMPEWTDFGLTGHPIVYGTKFNSLFTAPGKTPAAITAFLAPHTAELKRLGCKVTVTTVSDSQNALLISMDMAKNAGISELHEGDPYIMGSRLLGRKGLKDRAGLESALKQLFAKNYVIEPFNVGGGAVANNRNLDIALNPAWRDAIVHFQIVPLAQAGPKTVGQIFRMAQDTLKDVSLIDKFSIQSAAYVNEVSYLEPDWQKVMWGSNYPKLLEVKKKYDPNNTLWCFPCVGSEDMRVGPDGKLYDKLFQDRRTRLENH